MVTQSQKQTSSQTRRKSSDKPNKVTMWSRVASFNERSPPHPVSRTFREVTLFPVDD